MHIISIYDICNHIVTVVYYAAYNIHRTLYLPNGAGVHPSTGIMANLVWQNWNAKELCRATSWVAKLCTETRCKKRCKLQVGFIQGLMHYLEEVFATLQVFVIISGYIFLLEVCPRKLRHQPPVSAYHTWTWNMSPSQKKKSHEIGCSFPKM